MTRALIITADDFGLCREVNEAVELAHLRGVLTTTSLLVGAAAASDAIDRARRNRGLRVGLHLALCEGRPLSALDDIPDLVRADGEFHDPVRAIARLCLPRLGPQIERELRAQFEAFAKTGLRLDHVNAHNNLQMHPRVLPILLRLAREYGAPGIRLPYEPLGPSVHAAPRSALLKLAMWSVLRPWGALVKRRIRRAGFEVNDTLLGMYDCGALDSRMFARLLQHLPSGVTEIHCHPATGRSPELDRTMPNYQHERELEALVDPIVRAAIEASRARVLAGFEELQMLARGAA